MNHSRQKRLLWLGFLAVFIIALVPRFRYPSSRNLLWYDRSILFWHAITDGSLEDTYQQYHPGVTTMWVAGAGLELYRLSQGLPLDQLPSSYESGPQGAPAQAAVMAISIVIAACIAIIYLLLNTLTDSLIALGASLFLALDPFYITHSKMIHVDAFLASFMLVSVLSWFVYLRKNVSFYLYLSGIFTGLALLTKSPAMFLLPFIGLVTCIHYLTSGQENILTPLRVIRNKPRIIQFLIAFIVWGFVGAITIILFWPAMWVAPLEVISNIFDGFFLHAGRPHPNQQFFAGEVFSRDPGFPFYLATMAWKTTSIVLVGTFFAIFLLIRRVISRVEARYWLYILLYIIGFLAAMTLGAKKGGRYILPAMIALDVIAAWGLVQFSRIARDRIRWRFANLLPLVFIIALASIQAIVVLRLNPYYGTHHNLLLGGSQVAQQILPMGEQGEGTDLAATFLNSLEDVPDTAVAVQDPNNLMFTSNYQGFTVDNSYPNPNYVLYFILANQRTEGDLPSKDVWQACQVEGPLWFHAFDNVNYVWVCPVPQIVSGVISADNPSEINVGTHIVFVGHDLATTGKPGETLSVSLYWQSDGFLAGKDYRVFVHMLDSSGQLVAQHDGVPVNEERPTFTWKGGEVIVDTHTFEIPAGLPSDTYTITAGMYSLDTLGRLPMSTTSGKPLPQNQIKLVDLTIAASDSQ